MKQLRFPTGLAKSLQRDLGVRSGPGVGPEGQLLRSRASEGRCPLTRGTSSVSILRDLSWDDRVVNQGTGCGLRDTYLVTNKVQDPPSKQRDPDFPRVKGASWKGCDQRDGGFHSSLSVFGFLSLHKPVLKRTPVGTETWAPAKAATVA